MIGQEPFVHEVSFSPLQASENPIILLFGRSPERLGQKVYPLSEPGAVSEIRRQGLDLVVTLLMDQNLSPAEAPYFLDSLGGTYPARTVSRSASTGVAGFTVRASNLPEGANLIQLVLPSVVRSFPMTSVHLDLDQY